MSVLSLLWLFPNQVTRRERLSCNGSWGRDFWHAHYQFSILLLRFAVPFSFWFVLWDKLFCILYYSLLNKLPDKCNLARNHEAVFFGLFSPYCLWEELIRKLLERADKLIWSKLLRQVRGLESLVGIAPRVESPAPLPRITLFRCSLSLSARGL